MQDKEEERGWKRQGRSNAHLSLIFRSGVSFLLPHPPTGAEFFNIVQRGISEEAEETESSGTEQPDERENGTRYGSDGETVSGAWDHVRGERDGISIYAGDTSSARLRIE